MKMILTSLRYVATGAAFLIGAPAAQAALITYNFGGEIQDGILAAPPETYNGTFSFDDASVPLIGDVFLPVDTLSFSFNGSTFSQASGDVAPLVAYSNGTFLGLSYTVTLADPDFSIVPGLFDTSDAYLAYVPSTSGAGFGSISYTPAVVPVPGALWLLASALPAVATFARRRRAAAC